MLNILNSQGLSNVLVIVTRYFGGILLGTGGLVRAYSDATLKALESAKIINKDLGLECTLEISYQDLEKLKYYFGQKSIIITNQEFNEKVKITFEIAEEKLNNMQNNKDTLNFKFENLKIIRKKVCLM